MSTHTHTHAYSLFCAACRVDHRTCISRERQHVVKLCGCVKLWKWCFEYLYFLSSYWVENSALVHKYAKYLSSCAYTAHICHFLEARQYQARLLCVCDCLCVEEVQFICFPSPRCCASLFTSTSLAICPENMHCERVQLLNKHTFATEMYINVFVYMKHIRLHIPAHE